MIDTYIKKALLLELILQRTFEPTMPKFGYTQYHPTLIKVLGVVPNILWVVALNLRVKIYLVLVF